MKKGKFDALPLAIQRALGGMMNGSEPAGNTDRAFDAFYGRPDDPTGAGGAVVREIPQWTRAAGPENTVVFLGGDTVHVPSYDWDSESGDATKTALTYNARRVSQDAWTGVTVASYVRKDPARPAFVINQCRQGGDLFDVVMF